MKKLLLSFLMIGSLLGAAQRDTEKTAWQSWKTWSDFPAFIKKGLLSEKVVWKHGFQAAKKKLWHKQQLDHREQQYYKKFLREVGGVAAAATILVLLGGAYIKQKKSGSQARLTIKEATQMSPKAWGENLFDAATQGDVSTLKNLVVAGKADLAKDINVADRDGWTALMLACKKGNIDVVKLLLENNAQTDVSDDAMKGFSPLMLASDSGYVEIVKLLIQPPYNVPIDSADRWGRTAFMLASERGHNDVVEVFLKHGVDINEQQKDFGTTALIWAAKGGQDETVQFLLEQGADVAVRSQEGTALEIARLLESEKGRAERPPYTRIVELLERAEAA